MKHNILITGRKGSGKSTLVRYLLSGFGQEPAGFRCIQTDVCPAGPLFSMAPYPEAQGLPISREENGRIVPVPETFEAFGVSLLQKALAGAEPLVVMDEIGRFEKSCPQFLAQIDKVLDSRKTVIAVIKKEPLEHLARLCSRSDVFLIDLDEISPFDARLKLDALLWPERSLHWGLTLRLYGPDKAFGPGPMQLLAGVERTGSLHKAAAEMGMAYSKAWKLIGNLESAWGFPLLERRTGGAKGGSSRLTGPGKDILCRYEAMLDEVNRAADRAFKTHFGPRF